MRSARRRLQRFAALSTVALVLGAAPLSPVAPAAPADASYGISQKKGFDTCAAPTLSQMRAFWVNTPYSNIGIYISGALRACRQTNLTPQWLRDTNAMGWKFLPIHVGPQAPCTSFGLRFSWDPATAYQQGRNEALAAYRAARSLEMDTLNMPIIYDLEYFGSNESCIRAAKSFIQGWVDQMHVAPAQLAGVYGSSCASNLARFAELRTPPDFIFGANWDGNPNTWAMRCVSTSLWANYQRHKQYRGDHNETWNGVTLNIDNDCSNGPVYPAPNRMGTTQGCAG